MVARTVLAKIRSVRKVPPYQETSARSGVFVFDDAARAVPPAWWQSGHAAACKAVYAGSIPTQASNMKPARNGGLFCGRNRRDNVPDMPRWRNR